MSENKHKLWVTIGAALNSGFNAAVSKSTSKIKQIGGVIQNIEKQSVLSSRAVTTLKSRYGSLMETMNRQESILQKRSFYQSQIMGIVAMGAAFAVPVRAAMQFEKSLAGIRSVVNFKDKGGLQKLGEELTQLSRSIPVTVDELASIAAIGGRFGVAESELAGFSEEVAKTAIAWGSSITETSEHVGNLMKVFNVKNSELPKYFDAINELGNKTGATANNILTAINRSSDGLANFKLSIPHVAALTSTIMSFGEGAEQAGTEVGNMLQKLSIAPKLGADAQKVLHSIGLPSINLPEMISKDPKQVLERLLEGLAKLDPKDRSTAMYSIFGRGASKMVGKVVDNLALYKKNLKIVSDSMAYKGSRNGDYNIVLDTLDSKLKLLKNTITAFGREIGFSLAPSVTKLINQVMKVLNPVLNWMQKNKELTSTITSVIGGMIGLKIAFFTIGYASTFLFGGLNRIVMAFKGLRLGISLFGSALRMALFGWFGRLAVIGGTVSAGLEEVADDEVRFNFDLLSDRVKKLFKTMKEDLIPTVSVLKKQFSGVANTLDKHLSPEFKELLSQWGVFIKNIGKSFSLIAVTAGRKVLPILEQVFATLGKWIGTSTKNLSGFFKDFNTGATQTTGTVTKELIPGIASLNNAADNSKLIDLASSVGILGTAFYVLSKIAKFVLVGAFSGFGKILLGIFGSIGLFGKGIWFITTTLLPLVFQGLGLMSMTFWFFATNVIPAMIDGFLTLGRGMKYVFSTWLPVIHKTIVQFGSGIMGIFRQFPLIGVLFRSALMVSGVLLLAGLAYAIITNWEGVKKVFLNFWNGITTRFEGNTRKVRKFFRNIWKMAVVAVKFTYTLGRVLWAVGENIVAVIERFVYGEDVVIPAWKSIKKFFSKIWKDILPSFDEFLGKIEQLGITQQIMEAWEALKKYFQNFFEAFKPIWENLIAPIENLFGGENSITTKIKSIITSPKNDNSLKKNVDEIKKNEPKVNKTQNNNFSITINSAANEDSKGLADRVVNKIVNIGKTALFDEVPATI
jgi:TP901 family phage tail tape measure protein